MYDQTTTAGRMSVPMFCFGKRVVWLLNGKPNDWAVLVPTLTPMRKLVSSATFKPLSVEEVWQLKHLYPTHWGQAAKLKTTRKGDRKWFSYTGVFFDPTAQPLVPSMPLRKTVPGAAFGRNGHANV